MVEAPLFVKVKMKKNKSEIITFKADEELAEALKDVPNRSEFIRFAVAEALGSGCPLCQGSGILSSSQRTHWNQFIADHKLSRCDDCRELHLTCLRAAKTETP